MEKIVRIKGGRASNDFQYDVRIGSGVRSSIGDIANSVLGTGKSRIALISNDKIFGLYGPGAVKSLRARGFTVSVFLIKDGERYKSLRTLESCLTFLSENRISRTDAIVALGGGVVGDLAGFAASIYLRGIKFIQVPTTLLSMIDSSVGGKTGINTSFGKNLVGAFHQPSAVLIDRDVLRTLPKRELTAGFCEAVKQGAIGGKNLLDLTVQALDQGLEFADFDRFLAEQIRFKASIVAADERESAAKTDAKSRKILNFGHTFGHAIEKVTRYRMFKHGEAVGHGVIFAAELSKKLELLDENEVKLLNDVVHRTGALPSLHGIDPSEVFEAFKFDKKNIGESLQWVLLEGIGKPVIMSGSAIPEKVLKDTLRTVINR